MFSVSAAESQSISGHPLFFKIYLREPGISSEQWSEAIQLHFDRLKKAGLIELEFQADENRLQELSSFQNNSEFLDAAFEEVSSLSGSKFQ